MTHPLRQEDVIEITRPWVPIFGRRTVRRVYDIIQKVRLYNRQCEYSP